ncbi:tumor necrosis factor receptor superfamily member 6 [Pelmatolapia mariae]|uniref:tumor necrosis factor receptor superfamily member 6 n=1 Tax=Pelmatolapia mariae TaxID=158779 RepID=UPI002FE66474
MATKFSLWFNSCVWLAVSLCVCFASSQRHRSVNGTSRIRRETCVDGTYNKICCKCPVGQRVTKHCTNESDTECKICESDTYNSVPSDLETCQPCTSCAQPNANLEVEEECTAGRNAKCRCKKDHFCSSESCTICHPCKKCDIGGIKRACTANSDTVCNENGGGNLSGGAIAGIVIVVLIIAGAISALIWKKRSKQKKENENRENDKKDDTPLLPDVDIIPHLPDIAKELGWRDARNLALRTGINVAAIESYEMDYRNDAEERTLQLLLKWAQKEGKQASKKLIENLEEMNQKKKADQIRDILLKRSSPSNNPASNC